MLVTPAVLVIVLVVVQVGLWLHARQVVAAAAQEGVAVAQLVDGTADAGMASALRFAAEAGGVDDIVVEASRTDTSTRVDVHGNVPSVVPGLVPGVSAHAEGPVERWIPEPDR